MALIVSLLLGWTVAKPPETVKETKKGQQDPQKQPVSSDKIPARTEPLLDARLLNDLEETRGELLDAGNVGGEDTHVSRRRGNVDLRDLALVQGL